MKLKSVLAATALLCAAATAAPAAVIMNIWEDGSDVRVQATGTIDLTGMPAPYNSRGSAFVSGGSFMLGDPIGRLSDAAYQFNAPSNPQSFGGLPASFATTSSGTRFGMSTPSRSGGSTIVRLENGYVSGAQLEAVAFFANHTLTQMELNLGTYVFALPSDTITIKVGESPSQVPLPAGAVLLLSGLTAVGVLRRRRRPAA